MIEFKGSHFEREVILWGVRCYVADPISYRQLEEMMEERGVKVDLSTISRTWPGYVPPLEQHFHASKHPRGLQLANGRDLCEGQGRLEVFVKICLNLALSQIQAGSGISARVRLSEMCYYENNAKSGLRSERRRGIFFQARSFFALSPEVAMK